MEKEIIRIISHHTDVKLRKITQESHMQADLGMTSLEIANAMVDAENQLGIKIPNEYLPRIQTVGDFVAAAEGRYNDLSEENPEYSVPIAKTASDSKDTVLILGDSTGSPIWLEVRKNAYGEIFARRLGLDCVMNYTIGADTTVILNMLLTDATAREEVKKAKIVILPLGGNNIFVPYLSVMASALGMKSMDIKLLPFMDKAYKENKFSLPKMGIAMLKTHAVKRADINIEKFIVEMPAVIKEIRAINPDAIIITQTAINPFYRGRIFLEKIVSKTFQGSLNKLNKIIREKKYGDVMVDIEEVMRTQKDLPKMTNADMSADARMFDPHFNQYGHQKVYELMYAEFIKKYPQYSTPELDKVLLSLNDLEEEELHEQQKEAMNFLSHLGISRKVEKQSDDFSDGPYQDYNWWFNFALFNTYFYPLKKAVGSNETGKQFAEADFIFTRLDDSGKIELFDRDNNHVGYITDDSENNGNPTLKQAIEKGLKVFTRVFKTSGSIEILYAAFPEQTYADNAVEVPAEYADKA